MQQPTKQDIFAPLRNLAQELELSRERSEIQLPQSVWCITEIIFQHKSRDFYSMGDETGRVWFNLSYADRLDLSVVLKKIASELSFLLSFPVTSDVCILGARISVDIAKQAIKDLEGKTSTSIDSSKKDSTNYKKLLLDKQRFQNEVSIKEVSMSTDICMKDNVESDREIFSNATKISTSVDVSMRHNTSYEKVVLDEERKGVRFVVVWNEKTSEYSFSYFDKESIGEHFSFTTNEGKPLDDN